MKVLQVITSLRTGGAEKLIVDMVPLYQEQGHQVDVLLFDGTETPFKRRLQDKGVTIFELGQGGSVYNPLYIFKLIPFCGNTILCIRIILLVSFLWLSLGCLVLPNWLLRNIIRIIVVEIGRVIKYWINGCMAVIRRLSVYRIRRMIIFDNI